MHYHLIGIGGIGMSSLALLLLQKGHKVTGSDIKENTQIAFLRQHGIQIEIPHKEKCIQKGMRIVYSTTIDSCNIEIREAEKLGLALLHRSEALKEAFEEKKRLCVAGTHGKTSTTAMLSSIFLKGSSSASFSLGGIVNHLGVNGLYQEGEFAVLEADESDGSFLNLHPEAAIITNTDPDHLAYWKTEERLLQGYLEFIHLVKDKEKLFFYDEDPFLSAYQGKCHRYGFSKKADVRISSFRQEGKKCYFSLEFFGKQYKDFELEQIGRHQALNAASAIALSLSYGIKEEKIRKAFSLFKGVKRRLELLAQKGVLVYDDYAHHPVEIFTTLKAIKEAFPEKRLIAILQPHRYSRLKDHFEEFATSLKPASVAFVVSLYTAGEKPIEGIDEKALFEKLELEEKFLSLEIEKDLLSYVKKDDLCVFLGAGDITEKARSFATQLEALA